MTTIRTDYLGSLHHPNGLSPRPRPPRPRDRENIGEILLFVGLNEVECLYDMPFFKKIVQWSCGWLDDAGGMIEEKELEKKKFYKK